MVQPGSNRYTVQRIAEHVHGLCVGPADLSIDGVNLVDDAQDGQLTFIGGPAYARRWSSSRATAALVNKEIDLEPGSGRALVRVANADLAMAKVLELFAPPQVRPPEGVHPSAVVDSAASLGARVCVGPHVWIGPLARVGAQCVLHANVSVFGDVNIADDCVLWPGVVIRERCELGHRCILHPNVSIGADGFGYRPDSERDGVIKIPHIGGVVIGDDVELGAGTCVDRGKFGATIIGDGTKIDNLCQIAHNCRIGRHCLLAGEVGLAGSVTLGDGVVMGGKASVRDHITVGNGAMIAAQSAASEDVPPGAQWAGIPAQEARTALKQYMAVRRLPELIKTVRDLAKLCRR